MEMLVVILHNQVIIKRCKEIYWGMLPVRVTGKAVKTKRQIYSTWFITSLIILSTIL